MILRNAAGTVVDVDDDLAARLRRRGWKQIDDPSRDAPPPTVVSDELPDDKEALIAIAESEEIRIDRRWGVDRLTAAIHEARQTDG